MFEVKFIELPEWNEVLRAKAISYWRERRVVFAQVSDETLVGWRGSFWRGLMTFDMSKLRAELTIKWLPQHKRVECILDVNTYAQTLLPWNYAYFSLEMEIFESFLLTGDLKAKSWENFKRFSRQADRDYWMDTITRGFWSGL